MIADLKKLWQEAFHEPDDFTDLFFSVGYSPERCHCITENGVPVHKTAYEVSVIDFE